MLALEIEEAEKLAGKRLDRRRKYATTDDLKPDSITGALVFQIDKWTAPCSGCKCDSEYGCDCCHEKGSGCDECGYTGKRRNSWWVPFHGKIEDLI